MEREGKVEGGTWATVCYYRKGEGRRRGQSERERKRRREEKKAKSCVRKRPDV